MNSLQKGEGVPLLNFMGVFGSQFWTLREVPGPRSQGPEFPDPGVLVPLLHHAFIQFVFIVCQVGNYQNILKLNCKPPALTSHKTFRKTKRGLELASLPHFLHDFWRKLSFCCNLLLDDVIASLSLLRELLGNMCIEIIC